jgi:ATP-dependent exoDNAse (exonuclease V) beta subunit
MQASAAMEIGTLVHALLLTPDAYGEGKSHVCKPRFYTDEKTGAQKPWNSNATVCKLWEEQNQHLPVLSAKDQQTVEKMAAAFKYDPFGAMLHANGHKEIAVFAIHEETGLLVKGKLDLIAETDGGIIIADIKTTADGSEREFAKKASDLRYDFQTGAYKWMIEQITGVFDIRFLHTTIDNSAPHLVRNYELEDVAQIKGAADFHRALRIFADAKSSGDFAKITKLSLPSWHYTQN